MTISIRPARTSDADAIARIRIACWQLAYRGLIPDAYLDGMQHDRSVALWDRVLAATERSTAHVFVAENDGEVVAFAAGNLLDPPRHDFNAELSAVYVLREFQHAGIGRQLVGAVADAQRAHGANGLIVWVIAGNKPARAFYEALGADLIVEQPFEWDGMKLVEAGYGFRDLDALVRAAAVVPPPRGSAIH